MINLYNKFKYNWTDLVKFFPSHSIIIIKEQFNKMRQDGTEDGEGKGNCKAFCDDTINRSFSDNLIFNNTNTSSYNLSEDNKTIITNTTFNTYDIINQVSKSCEFSNDSLKSNLKKMPKMEKRNLEAINVIKEEIINNDSNIINLGGVSPLYSSNGLRHRKNSDLSNGNSKGSPKNNNNLNNNLNNNHNNHNHNHNHNNNINNFNEEYNNIFKSNEKPNIIHDNYDDNIFYTKNSPPSSVTEGKVSDMFYDNYKTTDDSEVNYLNLNNDVDMALIYKFNHIKNLFFQINDDSSHKTILSFDKSNPINETYCEQNKILNNNINSLKTTLAEVQTKTMINNHIVREFVIKQIEIFIELIRHRKLQIELLYKQSTVI